MQPTIKITINGATVKLSKHLEDSIAEYDTIKYTYLRQLVSRLKAVQRSAKDLSPEQQIILTYNTLVTERNVAAFAADQYAAIGQDLLHDSFTEVMTEIEELLN